MVLPLVFFLLASKNPKPATVSEICARARAACERSPASDACRKAAKRCEDSYRVS